jgi:diguanylate cyclase (GGDEF)-like protein
MDRSCWECLSESAPAAQGGQVSESAAEWAGIEIAQGNRGLAVAGFDFAHVRENFADIPGEGLCAPFLRMTRTVLDWGTMISLKKYLDSTQVLVEKGAPEPRRGFAETGIFTLAVNAYRSALREMGNASVEACPALGQGLKQSLGKIEETLETDSSRAGIEAAETAVCEQVLDWGQRTAAHYRQKTGEVKDLLLAMAQTAESVGERDQRCAVQISDVTTRLKTIASLEDLTEIRASIERSAAELKTSVDRMAEEGKQAIAQLRAEVTSYQSKLEEAEELAATDALTGLRNRAWVEGEIELRSGRDAAFCVAIVDIDKFKGVNDEFGHLVGDELLKQFAGELRSASRSMDLIGRWGGDEFILVLDAPLEEAEAQIERLRLWVCGNYEVKARSGTMKLSVSASIGLAEHRPGESMKDLLARADAAMYALKTAGKAQGANR